MCFCELQGYLDLVARFTVILGELAAHSSWPWELGHISSQLLLLQQQLESLQKLMEQSFAELPSKLCYPMPVTDPFQTVQVGEMNEALPAEHPERSNLHNRISMVSSEEAVGDACTWDELRATVLSTAEPATGQRNSSSQRKSRASRSSGAHNQSAHNRRSSLGTTLSTKSGKSNKSSMKPGASAMSNKSNKSSLRILGLVKSRESSLIWDATKRQRKAAKKQAERIVAYRKSMYGDGLARSNSERLREGGIRSVAGAIVDSAFVTYGVMLLVFVHAVLLGVEVDAMANALQGQTTVPQWFSLVNLLIVCIFVLEVLLKFIYLGCRTFWCGMDHGWNAFDFFIVALSVVDVCLDYWSKWQFEVWDKIRVWRTIRLVRALRSIRIIRIFRYIHALRTLVVSIAATLSSLFWTLALLVMVFYSFAIILTEIVAEHCRFILVESEGQSSCNADLTLWWRSVPDSSLAEKYPSGWI
eukprot:s2211_g1.t1